MTTAAFTTRLQRLAAMSDRALVAVADDNESVLEAVPGLLKQVGFGVRTFSSAESFLASGAADCANRLILDVKMPRMSGPSSRPSSARRRKYLPIVFITGQADQSVSRRVLAAGAIARLYKPFTDAALLEAVDAALDRGRYDQCLPGERRPPALSRERRPPAVYSSIECSPRGGGLRGRRQGRRLVVDDDVSVRESSSSSTRAGWDAHVFESAREFLHHPRAAVPSCLVLDVTLPTLNGLELQQRLTDRTEMPIIFITGYGDVPTSVQAMKAGAIEFLTKPFQEEALLGAIRAAIERSREVPAPRIRRSQRYVCATESLTTT